MKEGQMKINEGKNNEMIESTAKDNRVLSIPAFMDKSSTSADSSTKKVEPKNRLRYIKAEKNIQNNFELLKQLDELVGLILVGNDHKYGEIKYCLVSKDTYRNEKIKGVIKVNK